MLLPGKALPVGRLILSFLFLWKYLPSRILGDDEPTYAFMKSAIAALAALFLLMCAPVAAQPKLTFYEKHWSDVYKYEVRLLPRSAQAVVDSIYAKAKHDNNISEALVNWN